MGIAYRPQGTSEKSGLTSFIHINIRIHSLGRWLRGAWGFHTSCGIVHGLPGTIYGPEECEDGSVYSS